MRKPDSSKNQRRRRAFLSPGAWAIIFLAVASSAVILLRSEPTTDGLVLWSAAREHFVMYQPVAEEWNKSHTPKVYPHLLSNDALTHRMMSGFLTKVPVADLIEVERSLIGPFFAGPVEDVGFVDLTPRLKSEKLDGIPLIDAINRPSFSPWTSRGRIYGLPHDVHPCMLVYRADIVEAAGIDMSQIQTWDDFARVMRPLLNHHDQSGQPDHYPMNLWYTDVDQIESMILQAGGGFFDSQGKLEIDSAINAHVIATVISWTLGPNRICADAQEFTESGNELRLEGYVVSAIMPDWLAGVYKIDIPGLSGKLKLMPLPAWTPGGRRTSVWGGTMLGIAKDSPNIEEAWAFAKYLYLSHDLAKQLFETNCIISPVKAFWPKESSPYYYRPDPFFCGQPIGQLYISQAPNVPIRSSSPFNTLAKLRVNDAVVGLRRYAEATQTYTAEGLEGEARVLLRRAEKSVRLQMEKSVFLAHGATSETPSDAMTAEVK